MKCPFGTEKDINTYLEGYDPFKREYWKIINNEVRYQKDCKRCPNYQQCDEWSIKNDN